MFTREVSLLAGAVASILEKKDSSVPQSTTDEWKEFFAQGIFSVLLRRFVEVASGIDQEESSSVASALGQALDHIPEEQLLDHELEPKFLVEDVDCDANFPEKLLFLLNHLCPLVGTASAEAVQETAFKLLLR